MGHVKGASDNVGKMLNATSRQLSSPYEVSKEEIEFIEWFYFTFLGALFGVIGLAAAGFYWKKEKVNKNSKAYESLYEDK